MQSLRCRSLLFTVFCWRNVKDGERSREPSSISTFETLFLSKKCGRMERDWESSFEYLLTVPNVFWVVWRSLPYQTFQIVFSFYWCQKIFFFKNFFVFLSVSKISTLFDFETRTRTPKKVSFWVRGLVSQCQHWDWCVIIVVANLRWKSSMRI